MFNLKMTDQEVKVLSRLSEVPDFDLFREMLGGSLKKLREESDEILDHDASLVSKGQRQVLAKLISLTEREEIKKISKRVEDRRNQNVPTGMFG